MQALKGLVVGLGLLIVVAMAALAYGLYYKASHPDFTLFGAAPDKAPSGPVPFGTVGVTVPEGCVIAAAEAAEGRLILRLGAAAGGQAAACQRVLVVDLASGAVLGTVEGRP